MGSAGDGRRRGGRAEAMGALATADGMGGGDGRAGDGWRRGGRAAETHALVTGGGVLTPQDGRQAGRQRRDRAATTGPRGHSRRATASSRRPTGWASASSGGQSGVVVVLSLAVAASCVADWLRRPAGGAAWTWCAGRRRAGGPIAAGPLLRLDRTARTVF